MIVLANLDAIIK